MHGGAARSAQDTLDQETASDECPDERGHVMLRAIRRDAVFVCQLPNDLRHCATSLDEVPDPSADLVGSEDYAAVHVQQDQTVCRNRRTHRVGDAKAICVHAEWAW